MGGARAGTPVSTARDLRIDTLRGVALLVILYDHLLIASGAVLPAFLQVTPVFWSFTSAAQAFVFLSGFVYGQVHARTLERYGWGPLVQKTVRRAWHLYVVNLFTLAFTVGVTSALLRSWPVEGASPWGIGPWLDTGRVWALTIRFDALPDLFNVLPLYTLLLLGGPVVLLVGRRTPWGALALLAAAYGAAQAGFRLPVSLGFRPLAWMLLFGTGILLGAGHLRPPTGPRWRQASAAVVVGLLLYKGVLPRVDALPRAWFVVVPWTEKHLLEPVGLLNTFCFLHVVDGLTRRGGAWRRRLGRPFVLPGRYSLEVYAFGLVLTVVFSAYLHATRSGWAVSLAVVGAAWGMSVMFAHVVHLLFGPRPAPAAPGPDPVAAPSYWARLRRGTGDRRPGLHLPAEWADRSPAEPAPGRSREPEGDGAAGALQLPSVEGASAAPAYPPTDTVRVVVAAPRVTRTT